MWTYICYTLYNIHLCAYTNAGSIYAVIHIISCNLKYCRLENDGYSNLINLKFAYKMLTDTLSKRDFLIIFQMFVLQWLYPCTIRSTKIVSSIFCDLFKKPFRWLINYLYVLINLMNRRVKTKTILSSFSKTAKLNVVVGFRFIRFNKIVTTAIFFFFFIGLLTAIHLIYYYYYSTVLI